MSALYPVLYFLDIMHITNLINCDFWCWKTKKFHKVIKKYKRFYATRRNVIFLKKIFLCHVIAWHFRAIQSKNHCNAEIPEKRSFWLIFWLYGSAAGCITISSSSLKPRKHSKKLSIISRNEKLIFHILEFSCSSLGAYFV